MEIVSPSGSYYWREVAFDRYTGHGWVNSDEVVVRFGGDNTPLAVVRYQAQLPVTHTVTVLLSDVSALAMAGQPVWASIPARARVNFIQEQLAEGVSYARSRLPLRTGDRYTVATLVSNATVERLQQSSTVYPEWVYQRYLQLPDTLPRRVYHLAEAITARAADNVYDKAAAVEDYLRHTIAYNEQVAPPPAERDAVDYLLFERREGYCDYYASAMVVLLRAVGIPARLAAGYAQGEHRADGDAYLVRQKDAHAWPEVFFPEYGWVIFEPTAVRTPIERPRADQAIPFEVPSSAEREEASSPERFPDAPQVKENEARGAFQIFVPTPLLLLGLGLAFVVLAVFIRLRRQRSIVIGGIQAETFYARMGWLANHAGVSLQAWQTPFEQAAAIAAVVPDGQVHVWRLAQLITHMRYAAHPLREVDLIAAEEAWQRLYPYLVRAALRWQVSRLLGSLIGHQKRSSRLPVDTL
jgi:transglutaminase-like putative cysteine protease